MSEKPEIEIWKDVVGYEGRYQVSSLGRVKSLTFRNLLRSVPKILKQSPDGFDGYMTVNLHLGKSIGNPKTLKVHHIVLTAFSGSRPSGYYGCHNDGNYLRNYADNLRWDSPKANQIDRVIHGTGNIGEDNPRAKLTKESVENIRGELLKGSRGVISLLAKRHNVSISTISDIKRGKTWL